MGIPDTSRKRIPPRLPLKNPSARHIHFVPLTPQSLYFIELRMAQKLSLWTPQCQMFLKHFLFSSHKSSAWHPSAYSMDVEAINWVRWATDRQTFPFMIWRNYTENFICDWTTTILQCFPVVASNYSKSKWILLTSKGTGIKSQIL